MALQRIEIIRALAKTNVSCNLIAQGEDAIVLCKGYCAVNIKDILTTTKLRLSCSQNSNELTFQLQTARKGIIYISFVWDGV